MRIRSIGTRLTLWYSGLLALTFLILGGVAYGLLSYSLSRDLDAALNGVAKALIQRSRQDNTTLVPPDVDALFRRFFGFSPLNRHFDLLDPRGRRDPHRPHSGSKELPVSPQALRKATRGVPAFETIEGSAPYPVRVLTMPVVESGRVVNLVQVGMTLKNMIQTRQRFLLIMASVLPLGLLFAGGGGWLLARRALRPVDHMTRTTRRISGEHLDTRLQESGSGDELDRLAATLNEMLDRLDSAFHQMRRFSADASHELQTPLTILKGEMEVALRSPRPPKEYQAILKSGLEEIERITHLVEGLLLLSRADAGVLRLDWQTVDLRELMQEVCAQMGVIAAGRSIALEAAPAEPTWTSGDPNQLRRLLLNLTDNALKYTPAGGRVRLSLQADSDHAYLMIADTGIGLSEKERELIFSRFHRVTETRSRDVQGVGLGLSIARSIAKAHGGCIEVESTPGQGSTFCVTLPIR